MKAPKIKPSGSRRTALSLMAGGAGAWLAWGTGVSGVAPKGGRAAAPNIRWAQGWLLWRGQKQTLKQAIEDLAAIGADGIEYSPGDGEPDKQGFTREALRAFLGERKMAVAGMYFPVVSHDPAARDLIEAAARKRISSMKAYDAKFMVLGPPDAKPEITDRGDAIKRLGPVLNEVGRVAREEGVQAGLHPHLNTLIETPPEIDLALAVTDPRLVKLSADTGHIHLGGGDVVAILKKHAPRLNYLHFKDGVRPFARPSFHPNLRELGRGEVDFVGVMRLLKKQKFSGWINIEQDSSTLTARAASAASMGFVNDTLKRIYT